MKITSALCLLAAAPTAVEACTAIAVGSKATADGSVMVTHSDDGEGTSDARVSYIPARDYAAGATRSIWPDLEDYPRFVGTSRGDTYLPKDGQAETQAIGSIPQVAHTYAYFEGNYGMQNEHQVGIGESTCSAVFGSVARGQPNGTALLSVNELSRLALERAATSRDAVKLMGGLAEQHGFYGPGTFEGSGETLLVSDTTEAFVMHFLPDPTGKSAVWVAQRVPDENVTVVSNMFTIRDVDESDSHNFLGSFSTMKDIAVAHGLWDGVGLLDFTHTFSDGEYAHQYYSGRRMWGAFRLLKPSLSLNATYDFLKNATNPHPVAGWTHTYPWSVTPDAPVTPASLVAIHRDHYDGTPYSTTKGIAAGAYGSPDRYATLGTPADIATGSKGAWERTIGLYRTTYTWVVQSRGWLPNAIGGTTWFGMCDADKTVFQPMYVAAGDVHPSMKVGDALDLDRTSLYWTHRYLQNLVQMRYDDMMHDGNINVRTAQATAENAGLAVQAALDQRGAAASAAEIRERQFANGQKVVDTWWKLADQLMIKWADGYKTTVGAIGVPQGYDAEWLNVTGFHDGPHRIDSDHP